MNNPADYYLGYRHEMTPLLPARYSRVLDIGCGEGRFRENLTQENEYWGIEPVAPIAKIAAEKLDKVLVGTYRDVVDQLPNDYFDLVVCNDVIEHMADHDEFLQSIKQKINKSGCLIASIPNVRYLPNLYELFFHKDWEYKPAGILDRTHLRFFTEKSIRRTIAEHDFVIDAFMGINPFAHPQGKKKTLYRVFVFLCCLLLGKDVAFMQFGVRIRCR